MIDGATALVVMSRERRLPLVEILEPLTLSVLTAGDCREARALLQTRPPLEIVIIDVSLMDGNWCDIFKFLVDYEISASVVVASGFADERLWSEVLWRGAYEGSRMRDFGPRCCGEGHTIYWWSPTNATRSGASSKAPYGRSKHNACCNPG